MYIILICLLLAALILPFLVLVRTKFSKLGLINFLAILFFILWSMASLISENYSGELSVNNFFNRVSFLFSYLGIIFLYIFSLEFIRDLRPKNPKVINPYLWLAAAALMGVFVISPFVVGSVEYSSSGQLLFNQGPLVLMIIPIYLFFAGATIKNLLIKVKKGNYSERNQTRFIIFGLSGAVLISMATNIFIPLIDKEYNQAGLSNTFLTLFLAFALCYAFLKHQILDVRPLASRLISAGFLIISIGLLYSSALLLLQHSFFGNESMSNGVLLMYVAVFILIGLLIRPLLVFYRRLTDSLFIKNFYNPQDVIDEMNKVLISNLKTEPLLDQIQRIIRHNLGSRFTVIKLNEKKTPKVFHKGRDPLTLSDLARLDVELAKVYPGRKKLVSLRDIVLDPSKKELASCMIEENISVLAPLRHGNLLLGMAYISDKKYDLPYTKTDIKVVEIISNQTALAIENTRLYDELTDFNKNLKVQVMTATKELRSTNSKLVAIDKAKDEFISISSHQLRTPLTSIKGYISMILEGNFGRVHKAMKRPLIESLDSTNRMSFVVSDLLNLVRLRTDNFHLDLLEHNLKDVVVNEVDDLRERISQKGLKLELNVPDKPVVATFDEVKIRQTIKNFLYNAIFYTPQGGKITVSIEEVNNEIIFTVTDTGIGVPERDKSQLFKQFYRAKNAQLVRPDGTGVGLFISKSVINAHGGKIIFESQEGKGSTFGFSLN